MSERELLAQLVENSRKQLFYARVRTFLMAAGVAFIGGSLYMTVLQMVSHADAAIENITAMCSSIAQMGDNMNSFITENAQTVAEVMEKIEAVDFQGLNNAIKNLGDVVAPLAKFFNLF